jgi:hypothetical protein
MDRGLRSLSTYGELIVRGAQRNLAPITEIRRDAVAAPVTK